MIHLYAISCGKEIQGYLNLLVINSIPHPGVQLCYRLLQMPQQSPYTNLVQYKFILEWIQK